MAKVASPVPKRVTAAKTSPAAAAPRTRTAKSPEPLPAVAAPAPVDVLAPLSARLNAVEEKITSSLSALSADLQALKAATAPPGGEAPPDTFLPVVADLIRRSLMEHLTPVTAALKRLEERIGFIGNRLAHPAGGQERQKPWRHEQPRHARPRGHANTPRPGQGPGQGQPWTPPSAASVQGHFAPRPLRGGGGPQVLGDEEDS